MNRFTGRAIVEGEASGTLLCLRSPISFLGMFNPETGEVRAEGLKASAAGRVLVVPGTVGSTVAPYVIYRSMKLKTAPAAIVAMSVDAYLASGCAISKIPLVELRDGFDGLCSLSGARARVLQGGLIEVE